MSKNLQKVLSGEKEFVPVVAITVAQDKNGVILISGSTPQIALGQIMDLLMQSLTKTWEAMKTAQPKVTG